MRERYSIHHTVAHFIRQLHIARQQGDRAVEARILLQLGRGYDELGDVDAAIECCEQCLALTRSLKDHHVEGLALAALGSVYGHLGYAQKTQLYGEQSLHIATALVDHYAESAALETLGNGSAYLDDWFQASAYYHESLRILQSSGDLRGTGRLFERLGLLSLSQQEASSSGHGDWSPAVAQENGEQAIAYFEQCLPTVSGPNAAYSKGRILAYTASAYAQLGQFQHAEKLLSEAHMLVNALYLPRGQALLAQAMASLFWPQKCFDEAQQHYKRALSLYDALQDRYAQARCTFAYAQCLREQGNGPEAMRMAHFALHIYSERGTAAQTARVHEWIAGM